MLVLCCVKYSRGTGISQIVFYLGIADIGWSLVGVLSFSIMSFDPSIFNNHICVWSRMLYQFFGSASVMWSTSISIFLYRKFTIIKENSPSPYGGKVKKHESMLMYHLCSWGIPFAQCIATYPFIENRFHHRASHDQPFCVPQQPYFGLFWFLPIACAIVVCVVVYISFMRIVRNPAYCRQNYARKFPLRMSLYIFVMCLCWIPDIIYYCAVSLSSHDYAIAIAVNGLLELQGLFDCAVYGMVNKEFRGHFSGFRGFLRAVFSPFLVPYAMLMSLYATCRRESDDRARRHLLSKSGNYNDYNTVIFI
eukprot:Phypoly_transcript_11521.p1 GENE.Phypoly_transcript_11521~~Phypoly_transcript_11521.p1  ORF type:complete len:307 (+),score=-8.24 Phypoly_transcript_11521:278-1198(+)